MNDTKKATPAPGTGNATASAQADTQVQQITTKVDEIKAKQAYFSKLTGLVQKRETIASHLDTLDELSNEDQFTADTLKDQDTEKVLCKISLQFGSDRYKTYEICNAHLLEEVRAFLVAKLKGRMAEIEAQIVAA
jgi:hypothetical protein